MMFLAKILHGCEPIITPVVSHEWVVGLGNNVVKRPRQPWARAIKGGAAALSQTPHGAIASAKVVLEQEILKQRGDDRPCKPKYQRLHVE